MICNWLSPRQSLIRSVLTAALVQSQLDVTLALKDAISRSYCLLRLRCSASRYIIH